MTDEREERRLAAIVAAELIGLRPLIGADGEEARQAFDTHRCELVEPAIAAHLGRTLAIADRSWLIEFTDATEAVACALAIQHGMSERNAGVSPARRTQFCIGVDSDGADVARRLRALAAPGAICVSQAVRDHVNNRLPVAFEDLGERKFAGGVRAHRVIWSLAASAPMSLARRGLAARRRTSRELAGAGATLLLVGLTLLAYLHA